VLNPEPDFAIRNYASTGITPAHGTDTGTEYRPGTCLTEINTMYRYKNHHVARYKLPVILNNLNTQPLKKIILHTECNILDKALRQFCGSALIFIRI